MTTNIVKKGNVSFKLQKIKRKYEPGISPIPTPTVKHRPWQSASSQRITQPPCVFTDDVLSFNSWGTLMHVLVFMTTDLPIIENAYEVRNKM